MKRSSTKTKNKEKILKLFRAANQAAENASGSNIFPARLFRGEISLTLTFWIFTLSLPLSGHMVFSSIVYPMINIGSTSGTTILAMYAATVITYSAYISISLYRSAEHYSGKFGSMASTSARIFSPAFFVLALLYTTYLYVAWNFSVGA